MSAGFKMEKFQGQGSRELKLERKSEGKPGDETLTERGESQMHRGHARRAISEH